MKRRILALVAVLALVGVLVPAIVFAADEATVSCTVSAYLVSVNVTDGDVDYGTLALGATNNTIDLLQAQVITNSGTVNEDYSIKSSNATRGGGTPWDLVETTPGHNEFKHEFSITSGAAWTAMPTDNSFTTLDSDVPPEATKWLDLQITMPGTTDDYLEHTIIVTVMAVEHT